MTDNQRFSERPAPPSNQSNDHVERINTICPNCHATLHVRRAYIGNDVRCKYCDEVFCVRIAPETQAKTEPDQPDPRQSAFQAEHEQLYVAHNLLLADHDRLKTEYNELSENLRCVTAELEVIRTALGTIAPEEVGSLANERQSLSAEVHRLRAEIHASLATQSELDQLVAERQRWASDLDLASWSRDRIAKQLSGRDSQLEAARADHDRLGSELQTAADEIEQFRLALAQRDESAHNELRSEVENLRRELELAEQCHRAEVDRLNDQLAALQETKCRLQDEYELALARSELDDQSSLASERLRHERLTGHLPVLGIVSDESESQDSPSTTGSLTSDRESASTAAELEGLRARVADLGQRLDESEQFQREMAVVLEGMGIRCRPMQV